MRFSAASGRAHSIRPRARPGRTAVRSQRRGPAAMWAKPSAVARPSTNRAARAGSSPRSTLGTRLSRTFAMAASAPANRAPNTVSSTAATSAPLSTGTTCPRLPARRPRRVRPPHTRPGTSCQSRPGSASRTPLQRRPPCSASEARPTAETVLSSTGQPASYSAGTASRARASALHSTVQTLGRRPHGPGGGPGAHGDDRGAEQQVDAESVDQQPGAEQTGEHRRQHRPAGGRGLPLRVAGPQPLERLRHGSTGRPVRAGAGRTTGSSTGAATTGTRPRRRVRTGVRTGTASTGAMRHRAGAALRPRRAR